MNTIIRLLTVFLIVAGLAGCAALAEQFEPGDAVMGGGQKAATASTAAPAFSALDAWLNRNMLVITAGQDGRMDHERAFAQGAVIAYGEAVPSGFATDSGKKRLTAVRAAEVVAQRNLADFFAGKTRSGEVRFMSFTTRLDAFLKGAVVVAEDYDPVSDRAAVLLKLDLRGAKGFAW
jgi:hypothetical protein